ncbi:hypothetical protein LXL04_039180 [Taraxacum kok-saghyz]
MQMACFITSTSSSPTLFNYNNYNIKLKLVKSIHLSRKRRQPFPLNLGIVLLSPSPPPPPPAIRRRSFLLRCTSSSLHSEMESIASEGVYPLHRSKTIHLVRHAQGIHNVAGEKDHSAYLSEQLFDAQLTPLGWQQVDNLRKHVHASGLHKRIELVVVSPLLRTMQTAVGAFGGEGGVDGINPLMTENAGKSNRPSISSLNCPPFIAMELCREHLIENEEDVLWTADTREKNEDVAGRGVKFIKWLLTREEKEIAVVTHSGFLYHTLAAYGHDCHPTLTKEMSKHFNNCELRSMVIVDRSMIGGTNTSKTDFPGKIPSGADVPSDAV